jgi:hypothetical protein
MGNFIGAVFGRFPFIVRYFRQKLQMSKIRQH